MNEEQLKALKDKRNELMVHATQAAYEYFRECEVGDERVAAGEIHDNLRNAGRVY